MGEGGGGEEKGRPDTKPFLSFTSLPFSLPFFPFSPETPDTQANFFSTQNICDTHPCLNNGKCYFKYTDKRYGCVCVSGYTGENCEKGKCEPY